MLKLFFLCLIVVSIKASSDFTTTAGYAYDAPPDCNTSDSFQSCLQPATAAESCDLDDDACNCSAFSLESKCWKKYCPTVTYTSTAWQSSCGATTAISKPTPIVPKAPSQGSVVKTTQTPTKTKAPSAKELSSDTQTATTSSSSIAATSSGSSARVVSFIESTNGVFAGSSVAPSGTAKPNRGALTVTLPAMGFLAVLSIMTAVITAILCSL